MHSEQARARLEYDGNFILDGIKCWHYMIC